MNNAFDPKTLKEQKLLTHDRQLVCCRFSDDAERLFAAGFDGKLHRWNLADNAHAMFDAHRGWIETIVLRPDGERLFTADSWGQISCWPVNDDKLQPLWTIDGANASWLRRLAVSPDGSLLATCGNDRCVRVFSATDGKLVKELTGHEHCVQSVVFTEDSKGVVSGDQHGVVVHWTLGDGKRQRTLDAANLFRVYHQYEQGGVRAMTFDTDFKTLYCAGFEGSNANQAHGAPTVEVFDWASGKNKATLSTQEAFKGPILDVAYHAAGYLIGAGSSEAGGMLWFWKPGEAKDVHKIKNPTSFRGIHLHPDGSRIAATAFGDRGGQRGGNGRRLNKEGEYIGFAGSIVLYGPQAEGEKKAT